MQAQNLSETDPRHHTSKIKGKLDQLIAHLREDVTKVDEPKAQALFETTAEVLIRAAFRTSLEIASKPPSSTAMVRLMCYRLQT